MSNLKDQLFDEFGITESMEKMEKEMSALHMIEETMQEIGDYDYQTFNQELGDHMWKSNYRSFETLQAIVED